MFCTVLNVSKNDTDVAHYNFNTHQPISVILEQMFLREYAIKYFVFRDNFRGSCFPR